MIGRRDAAVRGRVDGLVGGIVGDLIDERSEPRERAGQRTRRQLDAGVAVRAQVVDPSRHRLDGHRATSASRAGSTSPSVTPTTSRGRVGPSASVPSLAWPGQAGFGEQALDVVEHLAPVIGLRRQAIDDDDQRQATLPDPAEDEPRDAVGVAGRGRNEQAQVGGLDELIGELAVGVLDTVDVGRVDEREARRPGSGRSRSAAACGSTPASVPSRKAGASSGWARTMAVRVVGRSTPVGLAARPAIVLKSVLLPAPVGPSRSTTSGASRLRARTRTCPAR